VNPLAVLQYVKCQELSAKMSTILEQVVDNEIISNITTPVKKRTRKPKAKSSEVEKPSPSVCNIDKTQSINYTVAELKQFLKENKLILTGTKQILHDRLFNWLRMTKGIIKTQAAFRGYFVRSSLKLFDKYQSMIAECVNDQDFYSFEPLKDIDKYQLICVKEPDGLVYGFDIASIYQYQKKLDFGAELTNPYNRNKFEPSFFSDLAKIATASRSGIVPTVLEINTKEEIECLPFEKRVELRAVDVFQHINSLGNYSDVSWFMLLSRRRLLLLIQELYDIWNYRLNINAETKMAICPPYGMPFDGAVVIDVSNATHNGLRNYILNIFENFVTKGVTRDSQCLGSFYVLGALTLVSSNAANASPWLYQSFAY
jgi:hypothetical protein